MPTAFRVSLNGCLMDMIYNAGKPFLLWMIHAVCLSGQPSSDTAFSEAPSLRKLNRLEPRDPVNATLGVVDLLLVEHSVDDAELALRALACCPLARHLICLNNGTKALDFLLHRRAYAARTDRTPPRLILLDFELPGLDSLEVLAQVRRNPSTRYVPVVIQSSSTEHDDVLRSYAAGANSYVVRPVTFDLLSSVLGHIVRYWLGINCVPPAS